MTSSVDAGIIPDDEADRMAAVRRYDVLDTPPDGAFDRVTALAARLCGTPMAIVSIVDTDRIWFKSHHGLAATEVDRDPGLCASAILGHEPWVVEDARSDPHTMANPLVAGELGLGFYAGVPLQTDDGFRLGTLCVLDTQAREVSDQELADLTDLAAVVMDQLELQRSAARVVTMETERRCHAENLASVLQEGLLPQQLPVIEGLALAARYLPAHRERVGGDFYDAFDAHTSTGLLIGDVTGHGPAAAAVTGMVRHTLRILAREGWAPAAVLTQMNDALRDATPSAEGRFVTAAAVRLDRTSAGTCTAQVALAGHPQPLIVRADGTVVPVGHHGAMLGWRPEARYRTEQVELSVGDTLVLYTDGILDARQAGERFGEDRLRKALSASGSGSVEDLATRLIAAVTAFTTEQRDDIAILVARVV